MGLCPKTPQVGIPRLCSGKPTVGLCLKTPQLGTRSLFRETLGGFVPGGYITIMFQESYSGFVLDDTTRWTNAKTQLGQCVCFLQFSRPT